MGQMGAYGTRLGDAFHIAGAPVLTTRVLQKSTVAVTELRCDEPNLGKTSSMERENAYLIALQLRACPNHDLYFDGRRVRPENYAEGVTSIYDLRRNPIADIRDPFHSLMFYLPHTTLDEVASETGARRAGDLRYQLGVSIDDPVVRHLLCALLPALSNPRAAHPLFLDHIALALTTHIAGTYGGLDTEAAMPRAGLTPLQTRKAKQLMMDCLNEEIPISRLANECSLSVRHFSRAFRISTGVPPHRWLLQQRINRAKELLRLRQLSLSDIASFCGFADQSHFTRVFTNSVGTPPGSWRRSNAVSTKISPQ